MVTFPFLLSQNRDVIKRIGSLYRPLWMARRPGLYQQLQGPPFDALDEAPSFSPPPSPPSFSSPSVLLLGLLFSLTGIDIQPSQVCRTLAGRKKKIRADISLLPPKKLGWSTMRQTHGAAWLFFVRLLPLWQHRAGVCVCAFLPQQQARLRSPIRLAVMMLLLLSPLDAMGKADCLQCKQRFAGREGCNVAALSSLPRL